MIENKVPRSAEVKRLCIEPNHKHRTVARQCQFVGLARSSWCYEPLGKSTENRLLMREIDRLYIKPPSFGTIRPSATAHHQRSMLSVEATKAFPLNSPLRRTPNETTPTGTNP